MPVPLKENKSPSTDRTLVWILTVEKGTGSGYGCVIDPGVVFQSCRNKLPQTRRLQTTETYSFTVLESRSLKPRCWQGHTTPPPRPQEESFLASSVSWGLLAILGFPWPVNASLQSLPLASRGFLPCVSVWHFSSTRHSMRAQDKQHDLTFADYICQDLISKYKYIHRCQGPGPRLISLGTQFNP